MLSGYFVCIKPDKSPRIGSMINNQWLSVFVNNLAVAEPSFEFGCVHSITRTEEGFTIAYLASVIVPKMSTVTDLTGIVADTMFLHSTLKRTEKKGFSSLSLFNTIYQKAVIPRVIASMTSCVHVDSIILRVFKCFHGQIMRNLLIVLRILFQSQMEFNLQRFSEIADEAAQKWIIPL